MLIHRCVATAYGSSTSPGFETATTGTWQLGATVDYWAKPVLGCLVSTTKTASDMIAALDAAVTSAEALIGMPLVDDCVDPATGEVEALTDGDRQRCGDAVSGGGCLVRSPAVDAPRPDPSSSTDHPETLNPTTPRPQILRKKADSGHVQPKLRTREPLMAAGALVSSDALAVRSDRKHLPRPRPDAQNGGGKDDDAGGCCHSSRHIPACHSDGQQSAP